jgi:hypothetical protein
MVMTKRMNAGFLQHITLRKACDLLSIFKSQ